MTTPASVKRSFKKRALPPFPHHMPDALVRKEQIREVLPFSRATIEALVNEGKLKPPKKFGGCSVWRAGYIMAVAKHFGETGEFPPFDQAAEAHPP